MITGCRLVKDPIGTGERKHIGGNMDECVLYPLRWSTNRVEMSRWAMIWQIRKLDQDHVFVLFFIMWELQYLKCMHVPRGPGDVSLLACWCWLLDFSRRFCQPPGTLKWSEWMSGGSTARAHSLPRRRNRSSACRGEKPPLGGRERNWGALKVKMGEGEDIGGKNNKAGKQEN